MAAILPNGIHRSSSSSSSVNSFLSVKDAQLIALEECIARIESVAKAVKLGMINRYLLKLSCPITRDFPQKPVLTNCGHIFNRAEIESWRDRNKPCALCRTTLTQFTPIHALREFVEDRLPKDPVLTCSNFQGQKPQLAARCLEMARDCMAEKEFEGALGLLTSALHYTNLSADYAAVVELYDKMGDAEKADLSRLYLSLYQLKEGRIQGAVETLKQCASAGNLELLVLALTLHDSHSPENIEQAMICALSQENPTERIFIYKQILSAAPDHLEAYKQLIPLIRDLKEKKELLLKAACEAERAGDVAFEAVARAEAELLQITTAITKEAWGSAATLNLPPYPQELREFLNGDCTIWPGKKRDETHIVVPLFPQVDIDGSPVPLTLKTLDLLDKSSRGPGYRFFWDQIPNDIAADEKFHYAVMTNDVIPGSRNRLYNFCHIQIQLLGYKAPRVFDAARAILWENRRSGKRCFNDTPWTYTYCKEMIQCRHLIVGAFSRSGLIVDSSNSVSESAGIAGWLEF